MGCGVYGDAWEGGRRGNSGDSGGDSGMRGLGSGVGEVRPWG